MVMVQSSESRRREALEGHLATLLGFDDVSDVFEHLLTIDTGEDLLSYLSQLLGVDEVQLTDFVDDLCRFQRGEQLVHIAVSVDDEKDSLSVGTEGNTNNGDSKSEKVNDNNSEPVSWKEQWDREQRSRNEKFSEKEQNMELDQKQERHGSNSKKTGDERTKLNARKQQKQRGRTKKTEAAKQTASKQPQNQEHQNLKSVEQVNTDTTKGANEGTNIVGESKEPGLPPSGKAAVICGCFGTMHKPLTNCLHCGRIACKKEGYSYCAFCGYLIEKVAVMAGIDGKFDKALLHKERLLKFDLEFAKRTMILDDQADYYSNTSSLWLDEDERAGAEARDEERRRDVHERKKQVLTINL